MSMLRQQTHQKSRQMEHRAPAAWATGKQILVKLCTQRYSSPHKPCDKHSWTLIGHLLTRDFSTGSFSTTTMKRIKSNSANQLRSSQTQSSNDSRLNSLEHLLRYLLSVALKHLLKDLEPTDFLTGNLSTAQSITAPKQITANKHMLINS